MQLASTTAENGRMMKEPHDPRLNPSAVSPDFGCLGRLRMLRRVPERVFLWGELPKGPWVSIIGTRRPSPSGEHNAFLLARRLAESGVCVLSGGAVGIDAAAHRGALAGGGATVVVAPTWLEAAYPAEHRDLFRQVIDAGGAYLTTARAPQHPLNAAFFVRNEVMAALSDAMVLGDCPLRSGARNAMAHARRMDRPRYCLPVPFGEALSLGNWLEAHELGAIGIVNEEPILRLLTLRAEAHTSERFLAVKGARESALSQPRPDASHRKRRMAEKAAQRSAETSIALQLPLDIGGDGRAVALAIRSGCGTVDEVAAQLQVDVAAIQHQILLLTLQGIVVEDVTGVLRYQTRDHE